MGSIYGSSDSDEPIASINVTPFVDIILVVLIIFIVTTPMIMRPSLNIHLPKAASAEGTVPSQLTVSVAASGETQLNGNPVASADIKQRTADLLAKTPGLQAIITADKDISHGRVIEIIDQIKSAGVSKFAISVIR